MVVPFLTIRGRVIQRLKSRLDELMDFTENLFPRSERRFYVPPFKYFISRR